MLARERESCQSSAKVRRPGPSFLIQRRYLFILESVAIFAFISSSCSFLYTWQEKPRKSQQRDLSVVTRLSLLADSLKTDAGFFYQYKFKVKDKRDNSQQTFVSLSIQAHKGVEFFLFSGDALKEQRKSFQAAADHHSFRDGAAPV